MHTPPSEPEGLVRAQPGVLIPAIVEPVSPSVGIGDPGQLRNGVRQRAELCLAFLVPLEARQGAKARRAYSLLASGQELVTHAAVLGLASLGRVVRRDLFVASG